MSQKKILFIMLIIIGLNLAIFGETSLAQYNLNQAFKKFNENNYLAAKTLALKSFQYDYTLPEYYYLMNLVTPQTEETLNKRIKNAQAINNFIKSNFIVSELTLLRHVAENVYDIKDLNIAYNKILSYKQPQDYLKYLDLLLRNEKYEQALKFINQIKNSVNDMQIKADEIYAKINIGDYDFRSFSRDILALRSNNFNPSYILYMTALYTNEVPTEIIAEFADMVYNKTLDETYALPILQAIFSNQTLYSEPQPLENIVDLDLIDETEIADLTEPEVSDDTINELLQMWIDFGGMEHSFTDDILATEKYISLIMTSPNLSQNFIKYNGQRLTDFDSNGVWELRRTFKDGVLIEQEFDNNQDGIIEIKYIYNPKNNNLVRVEQNTEKLHKKFEINSGDQSVINCYVIPSDTTRQEYVITFKKSNYILDNSQSFEMQLMAHNYIQYIDEITYILKEQKENEQHKHKKEVYVDGRLVCTYFDNDNNGIYDEKQTFVNGKIDKRMRDIDEDGYYEVTDFYENDKYIGLATKTSEFNNNYYYREDFPDNQNIIKKQWDTNDDGIFDITMNVVQKNQVAKADTGKFNIITARKIEDVLYPEDIVVEDNNHNSGYYIHKGKKFLFKEGKITQHGYSLEVKSIDDKLYLFDLNN